ncbi:MAG: ParB/RepB/Spo0J family partition protein [candidate division WOR-3 bacterium]|nr:ParB/RepB/Spo0J family partition protein [candidate division WOR-3 bacterium]
MRKRALGKGIEALISKEEKIVLQEGFRMIPISEIEPNPYQPREKITEESVRELVNSIKEKGVIEPVIVKRYNDKYILAAGERRFRAAQLAGLKEIPAIVRNLTEQELLEIGLIENLHREDLNPIEEAFAYEQLNKKFNLTHEQIAQIVGKDRSTITNILRLLSLPEKIKEYLKQGLLQEGHARAILALDDEIKMLQIAEKIVSEHLSVREAEKLVKKWIKLPKIRPGKEKEPNLLILEDELSKILRTRVTLEWKRNKGRITIFCMSLDDFNRIYELLRRLKKI